MSTFHNTKTTIGPRRLRDMVDALVSLPSVSSTLTAFDQSNAQVIHRLAERFEALGFDCHVQSITDHPGKFNLIANQGAGPDGLVLSGHTDTVPTDPTQWQSDPFTVREKDDRWYGLGTADMKSFFAIIEAAISDLPLEKLKRPLTILATADEESSMSGARALTAAQFSSYRYAVVGEPTDLRPIIQHKGIMMLKLGIDGVTGHSSDPARGKNAMEAANTAIDALLQFRDELTQDYCDTSFEVPNPTLNLGCIHGGDNPNRICEHVDVEFDLRLLPGMDDENTYTILKRRLISTLEENGFPASLEFLHPSVPPFSTSEGDFTEIMCNLSGNEPNSVAFATEAPFLTTLGMQTVVLGAGSINQAHQPNEYVELKQVSRAIDIIRTLVQSHCL
ncbi:MAG: acetylornithine deacetylase [Pseudomonadota bacterium]